MSYLGKADCGTCGHEVDVRSNVSGKAYYKCGRCGVSLQQKEERGHRLFMAKVRAEVDPDAVPPRQDAVRESPQITEPKPAAKPVVTEKKPDTTKPRAGLFGGVFSGA
jgi:DNA-directed RNA polymerase subunit RPC12/RpoP